MWELTNEEFTGLMQQYQKLIYTVCLQFVHEPHTAEDLTQDTFLSAFSAIDRCEPQYYKQWLVRVAANKCKDHLKSAWVRKVDVPGDDALPEPRGAPGSAAADLPSIFDRYYRSRSDAGKQGTGLGLSITKAIFQQHGFRFGVQSTLGKGTIFWFIMNDLPASGQAAAL